MYWTSLLLIKNERRILIVLPNEHRLFFFSGRNGEVLKMFTIICVKAAQTEWAFDYSINYLFDTFILGALPEA